MEKRGGKRALETMCVGVGQGVAMAIEEAELDSVRLILRTASRHVSKDDGMNFMVRDGQERLLSVRRAGSSRSNNDTHLPHREQHGASAALSPAYKSTMKRSPQKPLIIHAPDAVELTGPVYGHETVRENDHDLTTQHKASRLASASSCMPCAG